MKLLPFSLSLAVRVASLVATAAVPAFAFDDRSPCYEANPVELGVSSHLSIEL